MPSKQSAGILAYRIKAGKVLFMLVHPGGPFWKNKDQGSWSIPKGEFTDGESAFDAAKREFEEETGLKPEGNFMSLDPIKMKSGKVVYAWAVEGNFDTDAIKSNTFEIEWPPKSGLLKSFPEVDRAAWFTKEEAIQKINSAQSGFILQLALILEKS